MPSTLIGSTVKFEAQIICYFTFPHGWHCTAAHCTVILSKKKKKMKNKKTASNKTILKIALFLSISSQSQKARNVPNFLILERLK